MRPSTCVMPTLATMPNISRAGLCHGADLVQMPQVEQQRDHPQTALHPVTLLLVHDGWVSHVLVSVHACFSYNDTVCSSLPPAEIDWVSSRSFREEVPKP
jgi:hypothetical protein